ncbi:MAG: hypothetical protein PF795_01865, partial [Kiritimatiellae bacterium]|nr:hypothetical protein [Kiritimatiellia bacterium]
MNRIFSTVLIFLLYRAGAAAGELRLEQGEPVVEIVVHNWVLPDATRSDPMSRANLAVVRAFEQAYPSIVEERYRQRYEADPDTYGTYDWSRVSLRTRTFTGIKV